MKTYLGLTQEVLCPGPSVLTIGLFDGLHQGHQHILRKARELALHKNGSFVVLTFRSLPRVENNLILTSYHKKVLLESLGVDILVELWFSPEIKNLSPHSFLSAIELMFPLSTWVVGEDTHFGVDRTGTTEFLSRYASGGVHLVDSHFRREFSSTVIRESIMAGDISRASFLLGRTYSIMAKANSVERSLLKIDAKELCLPSRGVWQSFVRLEGDEKDSISRFFISEQKECSIDLCRDFALPRTLFVEVVPHSHILT